MTEKKGHTKTWLPAQWNKEADVVVVGYGGAGAVAAITAREKGAKVLILEKAPEAGGGTSVCSGGMRYGTDAAKLAKYVKAVGLGSIDDEMAEAISQSWVKMLEWLEQHNVKLVPSEPNLFHAYQNLPGGNALNMMTRPQSLDGYEYGCGRDLFAYLANAVKKQDIEVMLKTPAKRLVQDPTTKEILGVIAVNGGRDIYIKANKAVILTLGGFEGNRDMLATYIEEAPVPIYVSGTPYNTGDGIKMVLDVGAELWHMNGVEWARDGYKPAELPAAFWLDPKIKGWIIVNQTGRRFRNEMESYGHVKKHPEVFDFFTPSEKAKAIWPNYPFFMIFDEKMKAAGALGMTERNVGSPPFITYNNSRKLYMWSKDNNREIEKGWIKKANTLTSLAAQFKIDQQGLEETVKNYNAYCNTKRDLEFERDSTTLIPIDMPPYYGLELCINIINTQGGPKRNAKGQVMSPYGTPIPRLYSGGEFGSIWSFLYPGACNLSECIFFSTIAGTNAALEKPWS